VLIVNADDLGLRPEVTDAILECHGIGAVTSASAMVAMEDSERGFGLAAAAGLPIGLHLNLTTPFTGAAGEAARRRQAEAVDYFGGKGYRRLIFDPRARRPLDACVADQAELFAELAGRPLGHADGHQHLQTCPTVLSTAALGRARSLRRAHAFVPGAPAAKRAYRRALNRVVRARFVSVPFVSIRDVHPDLGGVGLDRLAELARRADVEVMVHPAWPDEREVLGSTAWLDFVGSLPTGAHADLR
jgi:predicted glycoside hydrolase/deacetylase ChbG (UPF0249 family)